MEIRNLKEQILSEAEGEKIRAKIKSKEQRARIGP